MKIEPVSNSAGDCFEVAIGVVAMLLDTAVDEAEWIIRRTAHLRAEGVRADIAARRVEAERIGQPWASWPADYPRF